MAVEKYLYLDKVGVQTLATEIFKNVNSRIKERILSEVNTAAFSDENHVVAAKAILDYVGSLDNYDTLTGSEKSILGKVKSIEANMNALTHLTYRVITGDIETQVPTENAKTDIIYLQHDADSILVANDGYVMKDGSTKASATDTDGNTYYAYYDSKQQKYFKATEANGAFTISSTELTADDKIFTTSENKAGTSVDNTYNLYVAIPTGYKKNTAGFLAASDGTTAVSNTVGGVTYYAYFDSTDSTWKKSSSAETYTATSPAETLSTSDAIFKKAGFEDINWLCVGDTKLDLANYWSKTDTDTAALRDSIVGSIADADIKSAVTAAYAATDPYTEG